MKFLTLDQYIAQLSEEKLWDLVGEYDKGYFWDDPSSCPTLKNVTMGYFSTFNSVENCLQERMKDVAFQAYRCLALKHKPLPTVDGEGNYHPLVDKILYGNVVKSDLEPIKARCILDGNGDIHHEWYNSLDEEQVLRLQIAATVQQWFDAQIPTHRGSQGLLTPGVRCLTPF